MHWIGSHNALCRRGGRQHWPTSHGYRASCPTNTHVAMRILGTVKFTMKSTELNVLVKSLFPGGRASGSKGDGVD